MAASLKYLACLAIVLSFMGVTPAMAYPEGVRLNNPGNIRHGESHWKGVTRLQNARFVRFKTPEDGLRALMKVLISYKDEHGLDTITGIISRYAPPSENNTNSYIGSVSRRSGYYANEVLDLHDVTTLTRVAQAIVVHENGVAPKEFPVNWYEEVLYHRAAVAALLGDE